MLAYSVYYKIQHIHMHTICGGIPLFNRVMISFMNTSQFIFCSWQKEMEDKRRYIQYIVVFYIDTYIVDILTI